jgi:hypothetical protein
LPSQPQAIIFLISATWVSRIIAMNHQHKAKNLLVESASTIYTYYLSNILWYVEKDTVMSKICSLVYRGTNLCILQSLWPNLGIRTQ